MALDRRDFLRRGAALTAAGLAVELAECSNTSSAAAVAQTQPGGTPQPARTNDPIVQFDFTGLFAFEYWQGENNKKANFVLPMPQNVGPHAPVMIVPWDAVDHTRLGGADYHIPPQPIQFGKDTLALWTLADTRVWVADYNGDGYDTDKAANLAFKNYSSGEPEQPASDPEWEYLHWFADLRRIVHPKGSSGEKKALKIADRNKLSSEILLTRGAALGRKPKTKCEENKKYVFVYSSGPTTPRVFATQMVVNHPVPSGKEELQLKFSNWKRHCDERSLFIKIKNGETVPISIMNVPLAHANITHFKIFYGLVKTSAKPDLKVHKDSTQHCQKLDESCKRTATGGDHMNVDPLSPRVSPYDGCIPPGIPQDPDPLP